MEVPRLREWRLKRGLAQRDLARVSGVGVSTIARLECGHQHAQPSTMRRLSEALGIEVDQLQSQLRSVREESAHWDAIPSPRRPPLRKEDV